MKNLICINTYKSSELIKALVWDYVAFVKSRKDYDFIVSLDGKDKETVDYCKQYNIPLLYSEANEGVGISKNRVIKTFSQYDNYFFIEDDIELLNTDIFDIHTHLSKTFDIHHFSLFEARRIRQEIATVNLGNDEVIQAMYGGAPFNFFTKKGLDIVGGFHPDFAKYKRFGHTEHTYRFVNNGLAKYPFQIVKKCLDGYFRWNDPISRIKISVDVSDNGLFVDEEALIRKKIKFFPVETLSAYKVLNREEMTSLDNVTIDKKVALNKKIFYFKLGLLEFYRKIKSITKATMGK